MSFCALYYFEGRKWKEQTVIRIYYIRYSNWMVVNTFFTMPKATCLNFSMRWDWVHLALQPLFGLLYQSLMINDDCGAIGGMWIKRVNRSIRRKPATMPLCPPQNPHELTRVRTRIAEVGSRRLTTWATARPYTTYFCSSISVNTNAASCAGFHK
jgi:hypothetical protein